MELKDEKGQIQTYGPYQQEFVVIPGKSILGTKPTGAYNVTMIGKQKDGTIAKQYATIQMNLWVPDKNEIGLRFNVIYEFNDSKSIDIYETYLSEVVTPKIPIGATVIIQGHTDTIGSEANNLRLSLARAQDVHKILTRQLEKLGRRDVIFDVRGLGQNEKLSPYDNTYPEERFYNRTVIIDIIPKK